MTIFDCINDILYKKRGDLLQTIDDESEFQPFMIQRWLSMYSPNIAKISNLTLNKLYPVYLDKVMWYKAFLTIIPQSSFKRISYIKKSKEKDDTKKEEKQQRIKMLAKNYNLSQREVEIYVNTFNIDLSSIKLNRSKNNG